MANYKVIQDIEAEDKLVGPLSLRQFIYAAIAAFCGYMSILAVGHGLGIFLIFLLPPMLFTGFFAFPWGRDQSSEVWALAKIRYFVKSRKRLWNQSGVKDLVTITAPKQVLRHYTNGLSSNEVENRLSALASTLDTRGWAVKNVGTYLPPLTQQALGNSDRLVSATLPSDVPTVDIGDDEDMLDVNNNPRAQQLSNLVDASTSARKEHLLETMRRTVPADSSSGILPAPQPAANSLLPPVLDVAQPLAESTDQQLTDQLRDRKNLARQTAATTHGQIIQPVITPPIVAARPLPLPAPTPPVTPAPDPATINLANNNDLTVATIARIANKRDQESGEVIIPLRRRSL